MTDADIIEKAYAGQLIVLFDVLFNNMILADPRTCGISYEDGLAESIDACKRFTAGLHTLRHVRDKALVIIEQGAKT